MSVNNYRVYVGDAVGGPSLEVTVENGDNDDSELIQAAATGRESLLNAAVTVVKLNDEGDEVGNTASFTAEEVQEWWA